MVLARLVVVAVLLAGCSSPATPPAEDAGLPPTGAECTGSSATEGRAVLTPVNEPRMHEYEVAAQGMHQGPIDFAAFAVVVVGASGSVEARAEGPDGQEVAFTGSGTTEDPWLALVSEPAAGDYRVSLLAAEPVVVERIWFAHAVQAGSMADFHCGWILDPPMSPD